MDFNLEQHGAKAKNDEKWEAIREHVHRIYVEENNTLEKTREMIYNTYGLKAGVRKWKDTLKDWGFEKNLTTDDMKVIVAKNDKRKIEGKETVFLHGTSEIAPERIERFKKRKITKMTDGASPSAETPSNVTYHTPHSEGEMIEIEGTTADTSSGSIFEEPQVLLDPIGGDGAIRIPECTVPIHDLKETSTATTTNLLNFSPATPLPKDFIEEAIQHALSEDDVVRDCASHLASNSVPKQCDDRVRRCHYLLSRRRNGFHSNTATINSDDNTDKCVCLSAFAALASDCFTMDSPQVKLEAKCKLAHFLLVNCEPHVSVDEYALAMLKAEELFRHGLAYFGREAFNVPLAEHDQSRLSRKRDAMSLAECQYYLACLMQRSKSTDEVPHLLVSALNYPLHVLQLQTFDLADMYGLLQTPPHTPAPNGTVPHIPEVLIHVTEALKDFYTGINADLWNAMIWVLNRWRLKLSMRGTGDEYKRAWWVLLSTLAETFSKMLQFSIADLIFDQRIPSDLGTLGVVHIWLQSCLHQQRQGNMKSTYKNLHDAHRHLETSSLIPYPYEENDQTVAKVITMLVDSVIENEHTSSTKIRIKHRIEKMNLLTTETSIVLSRVKFLSLNASPLAIDGAFDDAFDVQTESSSSIRYGITYSESTITGVSNSEFMVP